MEVEDLGRRGGPADVRASTLDMHRNVHGVLLHRPGSGTVYLKYPKVTQDTRFMRER